MELEEIDSENETSELEVLKAKLLESTIRNRKLEKEVEDLTIEKNDLLQENQKLRSHLEETTIEFQVASAEFQQLLIDSGVENQLLRHDILEMESEKMIMTSTTLESQNSRSKEKLEKERKKGLEALLGFVPAGISRWSIWKYCKSIGIALVFVFLLGKVSWSNNQQW